MTSFTNIPIIFWVSTWAPSTRPCSIGRHGVPKRWPMPTIAQYSAMTAFFNSGPRSERSMRGSVPERSMQTANMRRASEADARSPLVHKRAWHRQQMYVMLYTYPSLSGGMDGPSRSIMTSSQHSALEGIEPGDSRFVAIFRKRRQVMHSSHHWLTSLSMPRHQPCRCISKMVFFALRCAPRSPIWH